MRTCDWTASFFLGPRYCIEVISALSTVIARFAIGFSLVIATLWEIANKLLVVAWTICLIRKRYTSVEVAPDGGENLKVTQSCVRYSSWTYLLRGQLARSHK